VLYSRVSTLTTALSSVYQYKLDIFTGWLDWHLTRNVGYILVWVFLSL